MEESKSGKSERRKRHKDLLNAKPPILSGNRWSVVPFPEFFSVSLCLRGRFCCFGKIKAHVH